MERLGFFAGMLLGMFLPLLLLGGEIQGGKTKTTEVFYAGIIVGILTDITILFLIFKK